LASCRSHEELRVKKALLERRIDLYLTVSLFEDKFAICQHRDVFGQPTSSLDLLVILEADILYGGRLLLAGLNQSNKIETLLVNPELKVMKIARLGPTTYIGRPSKVSSCSEERSM
jgi:hypothetical protein